VAQPGCRLPKPRSQPLSWWHPDFFHFLAPATFLQQKFSKIILVQSVGKIELQVFIEEAVNQHINRAASQGANNAVGQGIVDKEEALLSKNGIQHRPGFCPKSPLPPSDDGQCHSQCHPPAQCAKTHCSRCTTCCNDKRAHSSITAISASICVRHCTYLL